MVDALTKRQGNFVYEATRLEALYAARPIVPEPLSDRDEVFQEQFYKTIARVCAPGYAGTPEAEHDSWWRAYEAMGWKYGPVRDTVLKTHPDMVPFAELPKAERDKDEVFLDVCAIARKWGEEK